MRFFFCEFVSLLNLSLSRLSFLTFFPFNCGFDTAVVFPIFFWVPETNFFFLSRGIVAGSASHVCLRTRMQENLKLWDKDTFSKQISSVILCDSVTFDPSKLKSPNFPWWHILWSLKFKHCIFFNCLATQAKQRKLWWKLLNKVSVRFFFFLKLTIKEMKRLQTCKK